jgi:hypothetical protein
MDCFNCLSLWIAAPAAFFVSSKPVAWFVTWLAVSGGACLLERLAREPMIIQPMSQPPEGEAVHVLWSEARRTEGQREPENDAEPPAKYSG